MGVDKAKVALEVPRVVDLPLVDKRDLEGADLDLYPFKERVKRETTVPLTRIKENRFS